MRRNAGERVRQASRNGDGRIGEAGGRSEPIGSRDVQRDGDGHPFATVFHSSQDGQDQSERCDYFAGPLTRSGSSFSGKLERRKVKH